jgi:hypothetical protein
METKAAVINAVFVLGHRNFPSLRYRKQLVDEDFPGTFTVVQVEAVERDRGDRRNAGRSRKVILFGSHATDRWNTKVNTVRRRVGAVD